VHVEQLRDIAVTGVLGKLLVLTLVFDAAPLITACKFEAQGKLVIDHLLWGCRIVIAPSVEEEVAVLGAGYPDGVVAGERIARGEIQVVSVEERRWARYLADYALGDGERDSIALCGQVNGIEALVTDDYLAFVAATRLGLKVWMLPDVVVELAAREAVAFEATEAVLVTIRPRYRMGIMEHSVVRLQEVKERAESRSASEGGNSPGGGTSQGSRSE
jgi:predicted nucleic acid-binding protein